MVEAASDFCETGLEQGALTRTNLLLEVGKIRRLRKALRSRSNSEAVRRVIDERLAVEAGLETLRSLRKLGAPKDVCTLGHLSSPSAAAWIDTGTLLRRARGIFGHMGFVGQFRDLLIAVEAVRAGATLVTENVEDFARWRSPLASAKKSLKLFKPS